MTQLSVRRLAIEVGCIAALFLAGCTSTPNRAPVEERPAGKPVTKPTPPQKPAPAAPVAGDVKGVTYVVKPGDTLLRIQGETGVSWRDLARWNNLDNPDRIEPGMVLRLAPQPGEVVATTKPVTTAKVEVKPIEAKEGASAPASAPAASASVASAGAAASAATPTPVAPKPATPVRDADADIKWAWPASGPIVVSFDNAMSKGIDIAGKAGDPVLATAPGKVLFAGPYRGYGNMVIIKHGDNHVSAYAHNRSILVKEEQEVRKGDRIAEMGSSDTDRVKLHFEIRRLGNPLDPIKLLPAR